MWSPCPFPAAAAPAVYTPRPLCDTRPARMLCAVGRSWEQAEGEMRLAGKVAIVTGGASGMGQSEATIFAREGAKVVVADVLEFEARQVVEKIVAAGGQARFVKLDVTSEPDWEAAVKTTVSAFGKLDILVNNAGISGTF